MPVCLYFCRDYFWTVKLFIGNCVKPNTCQDAVFPFSSWRIVWSPLHRCSPSSYSSMIPFWCSRVDFHLWSTGRATGRHIWKWWLQWQREWGRERENVTHHSTLGFNFTQLVSRVVSASVAINEKAETKALTQNTKAGYRVSQRDSAVGLSLTSYSHSLPTAKLFHPVNPFPQCLQYVLSVLFSLALPKYIYLYHFLIMYYKTHKICQALYMLYLTLPADVWNICQYTNSTVEEADLRDIDLPHN